MPLNRKNRVTVKKKMKLTYTAPRSFKLHGSLHLKLNGLKLHDFGSRQMSLKENSELFLGPEIKNNSSDGCNCQKCGNFNEYAEPNQANGSFLCFTCKNGY